MVELALASIAIAASCAAGWLRAERNVQRLLQDLQGLADHAERSPHG